MDPDLVRQQEEAEQESLQGLLLAQAPLVPPVPPVAPFRSAATSAVIEDLRSSLGVEAVPASGPAHPLRPMLGAKSSFLMTLGRFIQAAIAGAILGGGMGMLAVWMFGLAHEAAQIAIFVPAIAFGVACGGVSLKKTAE